MNGWLTSYLRFQLPSEEVFGVIDDDLGALLGLLLFHVVRFAFDSDQHVAVTLDIVDIMRLVVDLKDCGLRELDVDINLLFLMIKTDISGILVTVMEYLIQLFIFILVI